MATDIPQRLAALLAADIAGYTRLMELDEAGTVAAWRRASAEVIGPMIAEHQGRIVKRTGDGFLAEFSTVESAVRAALSMQQAFATLFADLPAERRLAFRMGVNLGDIWVDSDDIYGAGVNVAARLEALAEPGGICISGAVHDAIKHKVPAQYVDMGLQTVKNVAAPVHAWRLRAAAPIVATARTRSARDAVWPKAAAVGVALALVAAGYLYFSAQEKAQPASATESQSIPQPTDAARARERSRLTKSIAVLPFENLSPDPDDAYFAAGMHDEVILQLDKVAQLNPLSRTSVIRYAGTDLPITQIAAELGADAVMVATLRFADNRVRMNASLLDGATGERLWREPYEEDLADVFDIQADIALRIANSLHAQLSTIEQERIRRVPTESTEAYRLYLQAQYIAFSVSATSPQARELIERALELDPNFALAHAAIAAGDASRLINAWQSAAIDAAHRADLENSVRERARRALDLDPTVARAEVAVAGLDFAHWRWTAAREGYARALALQPSDLPAGGLGAWVNVLQGRRDEGIRIAEELVRLNPGVAEAHRSLGIAHAFIGEHEAAVESLRTAHRIAPVDPFSSSWLAYMEIRLGNQAEGQRLLELTERLISPNARAAALPELALAYARAGRPDDARRVFEEIQVVAARQEIGAGGQALAHVAIGEYDEALRHLEVAAEKVRNHEVDEGFYALNTMRLNILGDPALERADFQSVLTRLHGD